MTLLGSLGDSGRVDQLHASLLLKGCRVGSSPHCSSSWSALYLPFFSVQIFFSRDAAIFSTAKVVQVIQHSY